jgi:hypothetical protein
MSLCENIITISGVYKSRDAYHLVLKYAEYGCLRDFIINEGGTLCESNIKQIMQ